MDDPAEAIFVESILEMMQQHAQALVSMRGMLLAGSREVGTVAAEVK